MRILIVEDDDRVAQALDAYLTKAGYSSTRAADAATALELLDQDTELVLLDLGLPDADGMDLCRRIRARSGVPIIMATARSHVQDRINGLRAGADDFVVKPYDVRELVARIEAITRRSHRIDPDESRLSIAVHGVDIDFGTRQVLVGGTPIDLTRTEFDVLAVLARYPDVVVPRERIIREVWNTDWRGFSRSLEVHVASIRRKIDRDGLIETVRGVGYRITGA